MYAHAVGELRGDLALHGAGLEQGQDLLERGLRYALGGDQALELLLGLAGAQLHEQGLGGQQLAAEGLLHAQVHGVAELLLLRADALELIAVAKLAQYAGQRALAGGEDDLHARRGLILRGLYIPRVRDQPRGVARDDRGAVRGQKARGVVDVPVVHEQDGVQPGAGDGFFDSLGVCHFKYASNV